MPKGGKSSSSASSGTRKKHARKAAAAGGHGQQPSIEERPEKQKKAKKGSRNKEPRQKVYIPPVKPAPIQPDPLDTTGIANLLPPDLLVVLRKLGKKNTVTKVVALEELQTAWVDKCRKLCDEESSLLATLSTMLPVWMHHIPSLFVHPSRRVRLLAVGLHASLLHIEDIREQIISFLNDAAPFHQCESILGTWAMAAHDIDRQVSSVALRSWTGIISFAGQGHSGTLVLREDALVHFLSFIQRALLDPAGVYSYLNPTPPTAPTPPRKVAGRSIPVLVPKQEDPDASSRSKAEDEVENEQDRKARLRVSALGVMTWIVDTTSAIDSLTSTPVLEDTFANPALWTSLHHAESSPIADVESFGFNQPTVRKAGWTLLQSLLRCHKQSMVPILPILSVAVLRSAWVEPDSSVRGVMLQPLLTFLKDFPSAWILESAFVSNNSQDPDESSDEDSDEEGTGADNHQESMKSSTNKGMSLAYQDFLRFLELGCSGSPLQGYPTIVIIISTLPPAIISSSPSPTPLTDFFTSFWAAVDGRALTALERATTAASFLSSLLECLVFFARRILQDPSGHSVFFGSSPMEVDVESELRALVKDQYGQTWEALTSKRLRADYSAAGEIVAQSLISLDNSRPELFHSAWDSLSKGLKAEVSTASVIGASIVPAFIDAFEKSFRRNSVPAAAVRSLIRDIMQSSFQQCENILAAEAPEPASLQSGIATLANNLSTFGHRLFIDSEYSERIDKILTNHAYRLLSVAPSLLQTYMSHRGDEQKCLHLWHAVLGVISQHLDAASSVLPTLLDAADQGLLPTYLRPQSDELDNAVSTLFTEAVEASKDTSKLDLLCLLVKNSEYFLSDAGFRGFVENLVSSFAMQVSQASRDPAVTLPSLDTTLKLVEVVITNRSRRPYLEGASTQLLPEVVVMGYLIARLDEYRDKPSVSAARDIWVTWVEESSFDFRDPVLAAIKLKLKNSLADIEVRIKPEDILQMVSDGCPGLQVNLIHDIFPSRENLDDLLDDLSSDPIHPSLAIVDPLILPQSMFENQVASPLGFDERGYSLYARVVAGLTHVFSQDRKLAKENMWALRHLLALGLYAGDLVHVPWASSHVFGQQVMRSNLHDLISKTQQVTTYLLTSSSDDRWRSRVVDNMLNNRPLESSDTCAVFLMDLIATTKRRDNNREARILRSVLQHVLNEAGKDEADQWVFLARKMEKTSPGIALSIISSVTLYAPEPPRLDRYRNELASNLLGISAAKADTEGLLTLHRLSAVAPDPDSEVIFLSQQRAVNVVKTCQSWISSDEDMGEDVESVMTAILVHLAPILHTIPGSHWDFILDIIENNLENCAFVDDSTWVLLARTLRLILVIQDLASASKYLRAEWQNRQKPILVLVKDMITTPLDNTKASSPRSICLESALKVLQDMPPSMIDEYTLPKMCHLLTDSSSEVQKMSYQFLREAAKKWTEHVVIESAVDPTGETKAELPPELLDLLFRNVYDPDELESKGQELFGYFLTWMITFDLFTNASLKVRSGYVDHLRNVQLVNTHFISTILHMLCLYNGISKSVKLDIWGVDEFYVQYCEPEEPTSLRILAAHLYYRSLLTIPLLIRTWVQECKDRQLCMTVVSYTSQYFSQVLTQAELAHLKSPESMAELADEHMTVKVANSVNEVTASYSIDEHQLEITLKLPSDWPLHNIEVKDTKKVGVVEKRWRAWVFGVQQTILAHNGRIVDGLSLFKKNVTLHFEGQVECAICYSIISVTDQTLPRKPCKTCKNRFHSGCLYKWFKTSHTSSCPLCRSDII